VRPATRLREKQGVGAAVGSGSVLLKDVSPAALAVARGRQTERAGRPGDGVSADAGGEEGEEMDATAMQHSGI